jgi:hypothetical protein
MKLRILNWRSLLTISLGIIIGSAFCMKWMESDFLSEGKPFTIIGLELFYTKEKVVQILSGLDEKVKTILGYHLYFDFIFMAGVYPGVASLCIMAAQKLKKSVLKKWLIILGILQMAAWIFDILENYFLIKWLKNPIIESGFTQYHIFVTLKWIIVLTGLIFGVFFMLKKSSKTIF